jgi:RraA family protein
MTFGFQICDRPRAATAAQALQFTTIPVANISDCMHRLSAGGADLTLMNRDLSVTMSGPALTVRTRPGDNLMVHKAITMVEPGDVLVVDAGGDLTNAIIGEIMVTAAVARGLAGLVVYGAIRDAGTLCRGDLPVFARGATHRGPYKDGPGEINVPVGIGGMVVNPGDLVVGDADGVLSIPIDSIDDLYQAAAAKHAAEEIAIERAATGRGDDHWIDQRLAAQGYQAPQLGVPAAR